MTIKGLELVIILMDHIFTDLESYSSMYPLFARIRSISEKRHEMYLLH